MALVYQRTLEDAIQHRLQSSLGSHSLLLTAFMDCWHAFLSPTSVFSHPQLESGLALASKIYTLPPSAPAKIFVAYQNFTV
jgi:hypothetical protein